MKTRYKVTVRTGTRRGSGTDANVKMTLFGAGGDTGSRPLDNSRVSDCGACCALGVLASRMHRDLHTTPCPVTTLPSLHFSTATVPQNNYEAGAIDVFFIESPDVGAMSRLRIGHDGSGSMSGWFLEDVVVENVSNAKAECAGDPLPLPLMMLISLPGRSVQSSSAKLTPDVTGAERVRRVPCRGAEKLTRFPCGAWLDTGVPPYQTEMARRPARPRCASPTLSVCRNLPSSRQQPLRRSTLHSSAPCAPPYAFICRICIRKETAAPLGTRLSNTRWCYARAISQGRGRTARSSSL